MATNPSTKVTIACKLPSGLVLQLAREVIVPERVMGGGTRDSKEHRFFGEPVTIFGNAHPQNAGPKCLIVGGYALTPDVDGQFWAEWVRQNKEHPAVKSHLIFAYEKEADARADAKEHEQKRSGLERLDPTKLPKGLKPAKEAVEV